MVKDHQAAALQVQDRARTPESIHDQHAAKDLGARLQPRLLTMFSSHAIHVPDREKVYEYLCEYPGIQETVQALCVAMRARFPLPAQVALELYRDLEIDDRHLSLYIRQSRYSRDILDQIEEVYLRVAGDLTPSSGWIIATTDFRTM